MTLVRKFDVQLREIGSQIGMRFGRRELSSEFLGESLPYLLTVLFSTHCILCVRMVLYNADSAGESSSS